MARVGDDVELGVREAGAIEVEPRGRHQHIFLAHQRQQGYLGRGQARVAPYKTGKGTLQFPLDEPLPLPLIRRIVARRAQENLERKASKK